MSTNSPNKTCILQENLNDDMRCRVGIKRREILFDRSYSIFKKLQD